MRGFGLVVSRLRLVPLRVKITQKLRLHWWQGTRPFYVTDILQTRGRRVFSLGKKGAERF